ncbi:hypothetical protein MLD38_008108 [Melastoma candidum]|nr:hypothetical protein MLD38_008108 [Melastoma candidum]
MEKWVPGLRRRHAEAVSEYYGSEREKHRRMKASKKKREGGEGGHDRKPFITHFTGCSPCSGEHNPLYKGEQCWEGMVKALNFADNQVLRNYGFMRRDLRNTSEVSEVAFDYPADEDVWGEEMTTLTPPK